MARAIWSPLYSLEEDRSKRYPFPCLRNRTKWSRSISAEEHIFFVFPWKIDGTTWNFPRFRFVFEEFLTQQLTTTDKFSRVRSRFSRDFFLSLSHFSSTEKLVWIVVKWKVFLFEKKRYNYNFLLSFFFITFHRFCNFFSSYIRNFINYRIKFFIGFILLDQL